MRASCYILLIFYVVLSTALETRVFQGCALLSMNIFCYGGYQANPLDSMKSIAVTTHLVMDMTKIDFNQLNRTTQPWANVSTSMPQHLDYVVETRNSFEIASVSNSSYVIHGGCLDPACRSTAVNSTIQYDAITNSWTTLESPPITLAHGGIVYYGDTVYMWGGTLANDTKSYAPNVLYNLVYRSAVSVMPVWVWFPLESTAKGPNTTRAGHSTTLLEDGRIFYLGGILATQQPNSTDKYAAMNRVTVYDTLSTNWNTLAINGISIAPRRFHTATAVKGSTLVALYGGIKSDGSSETAHDFIKETCVLLDTRTMNYSSLQFENGMDFPGRYGHSAILYSSYLILLFGINGNNGQLTYANDISILDFTDIHHPLWLGNISDATARPTKTTNGSTTDLPTPLSPAGNTRSLSAAAIGGISVGCAIAGVGIAAWLCLLRQRRQKRRSEFHIQESDPRFLYDESYYNITTGTVSAANQDDATGIPAGRSSLMHHQLTLSPQLRALQSSELHRPLSSPIYSLERPTSKPDISELMHDSLQQQDLADNGVSRDRIKPADASPRYKPDGQDD